MHYDRLAVHRIFASIVNSSWWPPRGFTPKLGLAVSGGVDSMALASLCHDVLDKRSPIRKELRAEMKDISAHAYMTAFIVDHRLRPGSDEEAIEVAAELTKLNIESEILTLDWSGYGDPASLTNLETVARRLRYQALGIACADRGIRQLLVAQHLNDQAETVLSRLLHNYMGMGLGGMRQLAPIPECRGLYGVDNSGRALVIEDDSLTKSDAILVEQGGVMVYRPLLPFWKKQLVEICQRNNVRWFEDHTNADVSLTVRNTVRSLQKRKLLPIALRPHRLLSLAKKIRIEQRGLDQKANKMISRLQITLDPRSGTAEVVLPPEVSWTSMMEAGPAFHASLLRRMLELVTPKDGISTQDLYRAVEPLFSDESENGDNRSGPQKVLVAGVQIQRADQHAGGHTFPSFTLRREMPRRSDRQKLQVVLYPSSAPRSNWHLWDGRYWISVSPPQAKSVSHAEVIVRFLSREDVTALRKDASPQFREKLDQALAIAKGDIRFTIPAIVMKDSTVDDQAAKEEIVVLPSINWSVPGWIRSSELHDGSWRWDIRYKYVRLKYRGGLHRVLPSRNSV